MAVSLAEAVSLAGEAPIDVVLSCRPAKRRCSMKLEEDATKRHSFKPAADWCCLCERPIHNKYDTDLSHPGGVRCDNCARSFHRNCIVDRGEKNPSESDIFSCWDCLVGKKVCFSCHDEIAASEPFRQCPFKTCLKIYHDRCWTGDSKKCSRHSCLKCVVHHISENEKKFNIKSVGGSVVSHCTRCPLSYHVACIPKSAIRLVSVGDQTRGYFVCSKHMVLPTSILYHPPTVVPLWFPTLEKFLSCPFRLPPDWTTGCSSSEALSAKNSMQKRSSSRNLSETQLFPRKLRKSIPSSDPSAIAGPKAKSRKSDLNQRRRPHKNASLRKTQRRSTTLHASVSPTPLSAVKKIRPRRHVKEHLQENSSLNDKQVRTPLEHVCSETVCRNSHLGLFRVHTIHATQSVTLSVSRSLLVGRYARPYLPVKGGVHGESSSFSLSRPRGFLVKPFKHRSKNVYLGTRPAAVANDDIHVCDCIPGMNCADDSCVNRALFIECDPRFCPCGNSCENQRLLKRQYSPISRIYTKNRGCGMVANAPVKSGSLIIEYVGEVLNPETFRARMIENAAKCEENYYMFQLTRNLIIDAQYVGNNARFINHSCAPNCRTQIWTTAGGELRAGIFAFCDIPAWEELTYDYKFELFSDTLSTEQTPCRCGAASCCKFLGRRLTKDNSKGKRDMKTKVVKNPLSSYDVAIKRPVTHERVLSYQLSVPDPNTKFATRHLVYLARNMRQARRIRQNQLDSAAAAGRSDQLIDGENTHACDSSQVPMPITDNRDHDYQFLVSDTDNDDRDAGDSDSDYAPAKHDRDSAKRRANSEACNNGGDNSNAIMPSVPVVQSPQLYSPIEHPTCSISSLRDSHAAIDQLGSCTDARPPLYVIVDRPASSLPSLDSRSLLSSRGTSTKDCTVLRASISASKSVLPVATNPVLLPTTFMSDFEGDSLGTACSKSPPVSITMEPSVYRSAPEDADEPAELAESQSKTCTDRCSGLGSQVTLPCGSNHVYINNVVGIDVSVAMYDSSHRSKQLDRTLTSKGPVEVMEDHLPLPVHHDDGSKMPVT